ncbi:hypothetical protein [Bernardetia sp. MNP-M8]|uniref:hypothetical protein n=1 Tax=Bernardetia sp. MNP-M8 TaxID=3127470 RepID=UPI0030CB7961
MKANKFQSIFSKQNRIFQFLTFQFLILLSCLFYFSLSSANAQKIPVQISIFNQSTAIPFTRFFTTPVHLGLQVGTEFNYSKEYYSNFPQKSHHWFQTVNASYFYHKDLAQGIAVFSELGYEKRFKFGLALQALLGVGYLHTFSTQDEFALVDGVYKKKKDRGNGRLYPTFSLGAGYYLKPSEKYSTKLFVRYQSWAEYPYSPGFIPIMTHINFHVGYKFFVSK